MQGADAALREMPGRRDLSERTDRREGARREDEG